MRHDLLRGGLHPPGLSRGVVCSLLASEAADAMTCCSPLQRQKADLNGCRICANRPCDPAHVIDKSLGGCQEEECVIPLCRSCHRLYDEGELDVLPVLTLAEQAHAAGHVGLARAMWRTTNERWAA